MVPSKTTRKLDLPMLIAILRSPFVFFFPFEGLGDLLFLGFYLVDVLRMRIIFDGFYFFPF